MVTDEPARIWKDGVADRFEMLSGEQHDGAQENHFLDKSGWPVAETETFWT